METSEKASRDVSQNFDTSLDSKEAAGHSRSWDYVFNQYDENSEGKVCISRLRQELEDHDDGVPFSVVQRVINYAANNQNRYLTYVEFQQLIDSTNRRTFVRNHLQKYVTYFVPRQHRIFIDAPDGSYEQEYSCHPPAISMITLSLIMILIFIFDKIIAHDPISSEAPFCVIFIYSPHRRGEIWRFLTYMFVHADGTHIGVNVLIQLLLGIPLEMVHRWWRIIIIYSAGVVSGSLITSLTDPHVNLAGASGGVYSLLSAHIATIILNWTEMQFPVLQLSLFLSLAIMDTGNAIYSRYFGERENKIAYAAHIAGAGAGFLVGIYVLRNIKVHPWERVLWWMCVILFQLFLLIAIVWNLFFPSYFPEQSPFGYKLIDVWANTSKTLIKNAV